MQAIVFFFERNSQYSSTITELLTSKVHVKSSWEMSSLIAVHVIRSCKQSMSKVVVQYVSFLLAFYYKIRSEDIMIFYKVERAFASTGVVGEGEGEV